MMECMAPCSWVPKEQTRDWKGLGEKDTRFAPFPSPRRLATLSSKDTTSTTDIITDFPQNPTPVGSLSQDE